MHFRTQPLQIPKRTLSTDKRHSNGHTYGSSICKYFHGSPGRKDSEKINSKTNSVSTLYSNYIQLKYNFQKLGYDTESINKQINRARSISRDSLLRYKPKSQKRTNPSSPNLSPTDYICSLYCQKTTTILKSDPLLQHLFPVPPLIAYRQPPNFKRILTSNKNPQPHPGTFSCNTPRCQLCAHIRTDNIVTGPNNYKFTIRERFTCTSSNVVYLLSCLLCPKAIYIGETGNTIKKRINGHKSDI